MQTQKLFQVLVLGGAVLGSGAALGNEIELPDSLEGQPLPAFCSVRNEHACVENEDGDLVVREGFFCCWGTSCEME